MTLLGQRVLVGLVILAVILVGYLAHPFASALLVAAVLAAALTPWYERIVLRLHGRRSLGAAFVTAVVTLVLVLPALGLSLKLAQQGLDAASNIRANLEQKGLQGMIDDLPPAIGEATREVVTRLPRGDKGIQELASAQTGRMAGVAAYVLTLTWETLFQTAMMLVAFFFLLLDGKSFVDWITEVAPLKQAQVRELLADFRDVSVAVLVSSVVAAVLEASIATIGFLAFHTPQVLVFAAFTFLAAFIPVVGASSVVLAAAAVALASDHSGSAVALVVWAIVVSVVDHVAKPYFMKGRVKVEGGVIFFALLGGIELFGPAGLLAGPLIVAFFLSVVRMCQRELRAG